MKRASASDTPAAAPAPKQPRVEDATPVTAASKRPNGRVVVDVGGTRFVSSRSTLERASTYFGSLLTRWDDDSDEPLFLDADADAFQVLLSYMRSGTLTLPRHDEPLCGRALLLAEFLGLDDLLEDVKSKAFANVHNNEEEFAELTKETTAAAAFDDEFGSVGNAVAAQVLPGRFFGPPPPPTTGLIAIPRGSVRGVWRKPAITPKDVGKLLNVDDRGRFRIASANAAGAPDPRQDVRAPSVYWEGRRPQNITNLRITSVSKYFVKDAVELENGTKIENPYEARGGSTEIDLAFALPEKQLDDDRIFTRYFIPVKIKPNSDSSLQPTTAHAHTLLKDVRMVLIGEERFHGFVNALSD